MRVSLPEENGRVFICAGPNLAAPGTDVTVFDDATGLTVATIATDRGGVAHSDACDAQYPGRCDASGPGAFCAVLNADLGDRIQVVVEDVLGNSVTIDAGNMRDERTGATAIGSEGGMVRAADDPRYTAEVPPGAFDASHIITIVPVRDEDFPVQLGADSGLHRLGALYLDLGSDDIQAAEEIDLTIPAPDGLAPDAQILVGYVVDFRGFPEPTMVDDGSVAVGPDGEVTLSTNSPPFTGACKSGYYDFATPDHSVGYVEGVADQEHSTIEVMPSGLVYVFPAVAPGLHKIVMPVPADQPFAVSLRNLDGEVLDSIDVIGPPIGEFTRLPRNLTDDDSPAEITGISIPPGDTDVQTDANLSITFSRPIDTQSDGTMPPGAIEVRQNDAVVDGVWTVVNQDFREVGFFPKRPFLPGANVTVDVLRVFDDRQQPFPAYSSTFTTFGPRLVASVPMAANDIDVLQRVGVDGIRQYAVVAQDADPVRDSDTGLATIDLTNPHSPRVIGEVATPGIDRAVKVAAQDPPLVLSVDAAGSPQRFGTLRAFDFSDPSAPAEVGRRVLNLSPQAIQEQLYLDNVPNEGGVPISLALLGSDAAFVADPPILGIEGMTVSRMIPPQNEIESLFEGEYRVVATLRQFVLAAGRSQRGNELVVLDPTLRLLGRYPLGASAAPLELITAPSYPVDLDGDGNLGAAEGADGDSTSAADETMDLVILSCDTAKICVLQLSAGGALRLLSSMNVTSGLGNPRGGQVDPQHRLLYLAAGTGGLVALDLNDPRAATSTGGASAWSVPLAGQSKRVKLMTDGSGVEYALVAGDRAVDVVQLTPADAGLAIYDTNNVAVIPERFEESDGTFLLVNNDNDDASTDDDGVPILDKDDVGHVDGENDLRRLDVRVPMTDGVLTLDMPAGATHARVWLGPERDGPLSLPQQYDLGAGERPPGTVWIEGISPSDADRDVKITFHWEPPPGSGLEAFDDVVAATVIELDFIPGRIGTSEPAGDFLGDRKTTFLTGWAEEMEDLLQGLTRLENLAGARFGGVRIRGVEFGSVAQVTARLVDESRPSSPRVEDETAPGDLHIEPAGNNRTLLSYEDVMVYSGDVTVDGAAVEPSAVRADLGQKALPLHGEQRSLADTSVMEALVIQSAIGRHPPLIGGAAGPATLEVIDAQAFAAPISDGERGDALYSEYLAFDAASAPHRVGMNGAQADRWSRLVLRLTLPSLDPHTAFDFHLSAENQSSLGSHHIGDEMFPFGMLSRTGFEGFDADESAPVTVTPDGPALDLTNVEVNRSHGRRAVVATLTPPDAFPFEVTADGAGLSELLHLTIVPSQEPTPWATQDLLLVRPPVVLVHGLTGNRYAFKDAFAKLFWKRFIVAFADYTGDSVSGFDRIFSAVPREIEAELRRMREGLHSDTTRTGEEGTLVPGLRKKKIAATAVDVVAHSMGGLAVRWFVTEDLAQRPRQPRFIHHPASRALPNPGINGIGWPPIETGRLEAQRFRREANFMRGNIRKIVTTGSPQLGSPLGNVFTHDVCHDDRSCYTGLTLVKLISILGSLTGNVPSEAKNAPDFGTAIYDLAQGSVANKLIQDVPSAPVPLHAIAGIKPDATTTFDLLDRYAVKFLVDPTLLLAPDRQALQEQLDMTPDPTSYCPSFGPSTSDLVVPVESALYGTTHNAVVPGVNHLEINSTPPVAQMIAGDLLVDTDTSTGGVNDFENGFPAGQPWPLECPPGGGG